MPWTLKPGVGIATTSVGSLFRLEIGWHRVALAGLELLV